MIPPTALSWRSEFMSLIFVLTLVAIFYFVLIPTGIHDPDGFDLNEGLPPSFSARLVSFLAAAIVLFRMARLLAAYRSLTDENTIDSDKVSDVRADVPDSLSARMWGGVLISLLFAFLLIPTVGFFIASLLSLALTLAMLGERAPGRLVLYPVLVTIGVWLLFSQLLSVKLPSGLLVPLLMGTS